MTGFVIEEMFAFISVDNEDGDEGVMAFMSHDGTMMPMVGADMARIESLIPLADYTAKILGSPYEIKRFKLVETPDNDNKENPHEEEG